MMINDSVIEMLISTTADNFTTTGNQTDYYQNYITRHPLASSQQSQWGRHDDQNQWGRNQWWVPPSDETGDTNRIFRLILLTMVSTLGSMGGIFLISAITVIDTFQVRGNSYLVSLAFGHLLVTVIVIPASVVGILADVENDPTICHIQWLFTWSCFIVSVLSFMFMAMDNFFGLGSMVTYELCCTKCRISLIIVLIWSAALAFPLSQHLNSFGPEFCESRKHFKIWMNYHPFILAFLVLVTVITVWYFTRSLFQFKNYKLQLETNAASLANDPIAYVLTDGYLLQSNVAVYLVSLLMWCPMIVVMVINTLQPVTQDLMDTTWWIALSNSVSYSYVYAATNKDFREAFNKLFYYCCCKSHVTFARKGAAMRRGFASADPMGLRVHIIPGLNIGRGHGQYSEVRTGSGGATTQQPRPFGHGIMAGGAFAKAMGGQHKQSSEL